MRRLLTTWAPPAVIWIPVLVSIVFLSEGLQKFPFPEALEPERFPQIDIPPLS